MYFKQISSMPLILLLNFKIILKREIYTTAKLQVMPTFDLQYNVLKII